MKIHPTIRIVAFITLVLVMGLTSAWVYLRNKGLSDPVSPVRHEFFTKHDGETLYLIADPSLSSDPVTLEQLQAAAKLNPRMILWIDVQLTADDVLVVLKLRDLVQPDRSSRLVGLSKFSELQSVVGKPILKMVDVLKEIPDHRFVMNFRDYRPGLDGKVAQTIDELKAGNRILIQSDQDGILRDLRNLRATYLYGASQAQITQMLMLLPFGLESVAPFKGDVFVSMSVRGRSPHIDAELSKEIHRRGRKVIAGPIADLENAKRLRELGVDGFVTGNPEALVELIK